MTHEEYVSRLERFCDDDAAAVLAHAESCRFCRRERRQAEAGLSRLGPGRPSIAEEIARWAAVAAVLAVVVWGLRPSPVPVPAPREAPAKYRVVGGPSGVIAYTPGGIVVGTAGRPASKEAVR